MFLVDILENEELRKEISRLEEKCTKLIKELEQISKSQNVTTQFSAVTDQKASENVVQSNANKLPIGNIEMHNN